MTRLALMSFQLSLDDSLGRDACVIYAGQPQGRITLHAVFAREHILNGDKQGVSHVQGARHVGGRHHDDVGLLARSRGDHVRCKDAAV